MSLTSLSGTDLHGLEDLRSIETVGELLDIRERKEEGPGSWGCFRETKNGSDFEQPADSVRPDGLVR